MTRLIRLVSALLVMQLVCTQPIFQLIEVAQPSFQLVQEPIDSGSEDHRIASAIFFVKAKGGMISPVRLISKDSRPTTHLPGLFGTLRPQSDEITSYEPFLTGSNPFAPVTFASASETFPTKSSEIVWNPWPGINLKPSGSSNVVQASGGNRPTVQNPANVAAALQTIPGSQAQVVKVPCMLQIPSPIPVTVTSGVTQVTATNPAPQSPPQSSPLPPSPTPALSSPPAKPPLSIPSSFIDHSPPTIAILRPPSSSEDAVGNFPEPTLASSSQKLTVSDDGENPIQENGNTKIPRLSEGDADITHDEPYKFMSSPGLARNGLPIMYAFLPPSTFMTTEVSSANKPRISSPSDSRPERGKNPYFNVNKRKHFEYYEYF